MNEQRIEKLKRAVANCQFDLTVVLDNVHDNHNVGAVLRSCDSVGVREIYLIIADKDRQTQHFQLGKRTSMGTRKWVDVHYYHDREACMQQVASRYDHILGAVAGTPEVTSMYDLDFLLPTALVFGNESGGISEEVLRFCKGFFTIPQKGMAQSLNISVACAVTLYEAFRQRNNVGLYDATPDIDQSERHRLLFEEYYRRAKDHDQRKTVKTVDLNNC